jgi:hypothetical protein
MSYTSVLAALLTRVRAYNAGATFDTDNSAADDWTMLDSPDPVVAVLTMAEDSAEGDSLDGRGTAGKRQARHGIGVLVGARIGDGKDSAALATLHSTCDGLMSYLRSYARLNNTAGVKRAEIVSRSRARLIGPRDDMGTHWVSVILVRVWEEYDVSYASGDSPS